MTASDQLSVDTKGPAVSAASSSRPSPATTAPPAPDRDRDRERTTQLTTFPNPFQDEPEPGLLPSILSKVKSTFSSSPAPPPPTSLKDKTSAASLASKTSVEHQHQNQHHPQQTEAQAIAEAARKQAQAAAALGQAQPSGLSQRVGSQLSVVTSGAESPPVPLLSPGLPGVPGPSGAPSGVPSSRNSTAVSTPATGASTTPSVSSLGSNLTNNGPARRHLVPGERNWRPAGAAPAQVTVSPVTSVTTTVPMRGGDEGTGSVAPPMRLVAGHGQASVPAIDVTPASSGRPKAVSGRLRRGSIGTIPDSPSSVSLSAMISGNAELSQNGFSFVPGFQLPADDTRSVRSLGFTKRPGSVSKIIRRMRGEGLSKHYWMADEHCRECYDCKSVFTTWRRKHHCRICGQIFCGRCASNIIGARRFGQDGMVRVCNLCLKIMEDYDDDDDRRSISSMMSTLPDRISPEVQFSASPYAASQLFPRNPNESLTAIDEVPRYWNRSTPDMLDRPYTPEDLSDFSDNEDGPLWQSANMRPSTCAPFRRMQSDDHSDEAPHSLVPSQTPSPGAENGPTPGVPGQQKRVGFPSDSPHVMFPRSDTIESDEGRALSDSFHYAHQFPGLRTRLSSVQSLRGLSALLDSERKDGLWRARSHSFVTPNEFLSRPSLGHFNSMLQQSIDRSAIPHPPTWHRVLSRMLLRVSTNLRPSVRTGDPIDIRTYVKIKKVPGGKITDSEYVDGIVITKNVAHKGMARRLVNPRIMLITFPLDYHRVETQFMSLDPILKQERDYLRLLTKRIIDLRPHIVLVERFVSRIALDFLYEANIVVARGVKFSAIHQVARCTHADIIASMDRLALEPRLGRCADFRVQTFEHDLIPGRRKTYMRFEGTHNGFGGTIILRGGDMPTLGKVKVIADFMTLVAYHLKNEAFLYGDEFHMLPPHPPLPEEYQELLKMLSDNDANPQKAFGSTEERDPETTPRAAEVDVEKEQAHYDALRLSRQIAESLEPYLTTVLSASVAVRFPPPMPLAKMAALDRTLNLLRKRKDEKEMTEILQEEKGEKPQPSTIPSASAAPAIPAAAPTVASAPTPAPGPPQATAAPATTAPSASAPAPAPPAISTATATATVIEPATPTGSSSLSPVDAQNDDGRATPTPAPPSSPTKEPDNLPPFSPAPPAPATVAPTQPPTQTAPSEKLLLTPTPQANSAASSQIIASGPKGFTGDPYRVLLKAEDFTEVSRLAFVEYEHAEQLKIWQHYVKRHPTPLHPKDYQGIIYLQALYRQGQEKPCTEPTRQQINFYQDDDQTLGQFLGSMVSNAGRLCPNKACDQLMLFHYDVLVHADRRLQIVMEQFMCPLAGHEEQILTWSYCRQCNKSWEPTIIREETWRMSWGSYLEHCFYPPKTVTGFGCTHDAYREHIRYFAHHNMVIRIHNDEVELYEPVRPCVKLLVKVEDKVRIKNQEYESALQKTAAFFDSVLFRLRGFTDDIVDPEKVAQLRQDRDSLLTRAVADRDEMVNSLNRTYKQTPPTDVLAINVVLQALQEKVIQWDLDFLEVEKMYTPTEKDLRRMTATHLKRLFATQDVFGTLDKNMTNLSVPEVDEPEKGADGQDVSKPPSPTTTENLEATLQLPSTPLDSPMCADSPGGEISNPLESLSLHSPTTKPDLTSSESVTTPTPTLARSATNPLSLPVSDYDSDSTISAAPVVRSNTFPEIASSGADSDAHGFVSRLPRRSRPAPSVADLMKRFQESTEGQKFEPIPQQDIPSSLERTHSMGLGLQRRRLEAPEPPPEDLASSLERPRSIGGTRRRMEPPDISDSDAAIHLSRPRLRRRGHEQPTKGESSRSTLFSDPDRSYAVGASRGASAQGLPRRAADRSSSRPPRSRATSPSPSQRSTKDGRLAAPTPRLVGKTVSYEGKPRLPGRVKTPRKASEGTSTQPSPGHIRGLPRRVVGAGTRVTSIARHFDKISREAERDRQKRMSQARGKRAGRVGVTKAKVQVFNNVRDAFKDEFDSDSSAADNEADEGDASEYSVDSTGRVRPRRKSTAKAAKKETAVSGLPSTEDAPSALPEGPAPEQTAEPEPVTTAPEGDTPTSEVHSVHLSDSGTTDAPGRKDRLHIELAPFDTNAPLPPMTPQPHPPTEDEGGRKDLSQISQMSESEMSSGGGPERSSILKTLTGLWAFRAGDFTPLEYPLSAAEHIFVDSRVIVRENEPTSIIAFTLSSKTYRDQMRTVGQAKGRRQEPSLLEEVGGERQWDIVSIDEALEQDDHGRREVGTHLKYDFEAGSSTISCRIFFAEQFAALRQSCQCEDIFVESLARCAKFDASGGKSGSAFLKTKDDRFIVKEISRYEMDAITKFAPAYFEYTATALQRGRPTALAKTYGIFKIGFRNAVTGRSMQMNVIVQENLFYSRTFSKIYDLKGSTRNRLVKPTGKPNEVLLDENLMEISHTNPLYLRDHSKRILRTGLWNDTLFLSNLNIMDYSLVVGVDNINKELVVGVVDFLRPFTLDKKIESWVKDFGGAGRTEPTIVTPVQYRKRFRTAMERYFPSVPDRWDGATGGGEEVVEEVV